MTQGGRTPGSPECEQSAVLSAGESMEKLYIHISTNTLVYYRQA